MTTPVFSSVQIRGLVPILYDVANRVLRKLVFALSVLRSILIQLAEVLLRESNAKVYSPEEPNVLDMSEWLSRFALEAVGQAILGHTFDPLNSPNNNPYSSAIKELMHAYRFPVFLAFRTKFLPCQSHNLPAGRHASTLTVVVETWSSFVSTKAR